MSRTDLCLAYVIIAKYARLTLSLEARELCTGHPWPGACAQTTMAYIAGNTRQAHARRLSDGNEQQFPCFPHPDVRLPESDGTPFPSRGDGGVRKTPNTNDSRIGARSAGGASTVGTSQKRPSSEGCNSDGGRSKRTYGEDGGRGGRPGPSGVGSADSQELGKAVSIGVDVGNSGTVIRITPLHSSQRIASFPLNDLDYDAMPCSSCDLSVCTHRRRDIASTTKA